MEEIWKILKHSDDENIEQFTKKYISSHYSVIRYLTSDSNSLYYEIDKCGKQLLRVFPEKLKENNCIHNQNNTTK